MELTIQWSAMGGTASREHPVHVLPETEGAEEQTEGTHFWDHSGICLMRKGKGTEKAKGRGKGIVCVNLGTRGHAIKH